MTRRFQAIVVTEFALAGLIALLPFEHFGSGPRTFLLWLAPLALIWDDRSNLRQQSATGGGRRWWSELAVGGGFLLAVMGLALLSSAMRERHGDPAELITDVLRRIGPFALVFPFLLRIARDRSPAVPLDRFLWAALAAWGVWMAFAAVYGIQPEQSLKLFFKEGGSFLIAAGCLTICMMRRPRSARYWLGWMIAIGGLIALAAIVLILAGYISGGPLRDRLIEADMIRFDPSISGGGTLLVQFPFKSHNRLASYLLVAMMLIPPAFDRAASAMGRSLLILCAATMLFAITLTGTRGAIFAVGCGLIIATAARPKLFLVLVPFALGLYLALPSGSRDRMRSIVDIATYTRPGTAWQYRMTGWKIAREMIAERPILGWGLGWTTYERMYPRFSRGKRSFEKNMPHAHNNYLEIMFETGGIGLAIFGCYQALLLASLLRLLFKSKRGALAHRTAWGLAGLMVAIHGFGMLNYSLRRTVGYEVWMAWGIIHALAILNLHALDSKNDPEHSVQ